MILDSTNIVYFICIIYVEFVCLYIYIYIHVYQTTLYQTVNITCGEHVAYISIHNLYFYIYIIYIFTYIYIFIYMMYT